MKRLTVVIVSTMMLLVSCGTPKPEPVIAPDAEIEKRIEEILDGMTLEEKIGQMTQLTIYPMLGGYVNGEFHLDEEKLADAIGKFKIGSVLNSPNCALTPEKWQQVIGRIQEVSMAEIGIPCIYGLDQNHGTTYTIGGTFFPQNINLAATFNRELATEAGRVTAYETRACSCPWTFCPTLDLGRDPRWSRQWENFGEDCYLNGEMGAAAVRGFQGDDPNHVGKKRIAACLKHYMGYGVPFSGKDRTPAYIAPAEILEKHFAPYKAAIEAGALSIMVNSSSVNGVPVHASHEWLTEWLKEGLNWDGMIVTDWADINNLYTREKVAHDKKEAIKMAINAGIDMTMDPYSTQFCTLLKELVEEGGVKMSRVDDAVRRILRLKLRLGLFEKPITPLEDYPEFASDGVAAIATTAAEESMVLLKNDNGILPLKRGVKILVTGPNANSMRCLNGGWSYTWQGDRANEFTARYNTIYEALSAKFGAANVRHEAGVSYVDRGLWWQEKEPQIERAVAAARGVDVIVACIGENSYCETPGNLDDLNLSVNQQNLVKALARTGKPIVLVLNEGRPRIIREIEPLAEAVVDVLLPGNYGGDALANLLAGDANFSGKLPITYPKHINALATYDYKVSEVADKMAGAYDYSAVVSVQWAFGYGLSYTTFAYSNLKVDKQEFTADDTLTFTVDVTNTGNVAGKESVLLFSSDLVASTVPDSRRLRAFEKIELQPGECRSVEFKIPATALAFVGYDQKWRLEEGDFRVQVGTEVVELKCRETKLWPSLTIR